MNDNDTKKFRDISDRIQGKYVPVVKFGGTNKYINRNYKNDNDDTSNISFTGDDYNAGNIDIYYDNKYGINRVCFSPQGKYVAGCGSNGIIYVYDLYENKLLTKICTKIDNIKDLIISDNDKYIYACGDNRIIEIFDIFENKKVCNDNIAKYVDISIPRIIENINRKPNDRLDSNKYDNNNNYFNNNYNSTNNRVFGHLNNSAKKSMIDNVYAPCHKTKYKDLTYNKVIYVPIYNYNDLIKCNINMIDLNRIKLNKINEIINKSIFIIKDSHEYRTSCLAVPNISTFLIYSGGGDGLLKIWDIRMNLFTLNKNNFNRSMSDIIFLDNKNPYASICSHEDILTSINFNNTIDYEENAYKLRKEDKYDEMKKKLRKNNIASLKNDLKKGEKKVNDDTSESSVTDASSSSSSFGSMCSSISYSSFTFNLSKTKFNNILMTSGYDGYIRIYDINNNIIKSFYDEEKSITHCMFSNNNKYIISTNKSKYCKIFDFIYMNNKKNTKNMLTYLTNYKSYYLNSTKKNNETSKEEVHNSSENSNSSGNNNSMNGYNDSSNGNNSSINCNNIGSNGNNNRGEVYEDNFIMQMYNDNYLQPCHIKNLYEDEDLEERIKELNELNKKIANDKKKVVNSSSGGMNEKNSESDCSYSSSDSSNFDENVMRANIFYEHVNKKLEPTWSLFVDNMKYMSLIPYEVMSESLKKNYDYIKAHYNNLHSQSYDNCNNENSEKQKEQLKIDEKKHKFYYELSDIIHNEADIPKFYSCVAGDKCIIPSIDTYAHVYDIYTGFHVNTINNLYLPNYNIDHSYLYSCNINMEIPKKKFISFLTSVDTYPKNQNIIATSNGYPDGSIVIWVFAPF
ncbi:WD40-repeat protein-like protein, putative [Plasmodium malariae]|uniref:WD40-repeat protein-like protein, putative n=1 Tax=Plasmodium malariae TaxID=5858 RepID=A0A1C3L1S0_PLAMA|nr:WD40-repeat protein-like protein, putative [Plasmodium malariae]